MATRPASPATACRWWRTPLPDYPGPLAGILAALDWAAEHRPDLPTVLSRPRRRPFLPHDLAERLEAARQAAGTPHGLRRLGWLDASAGRRCGLSRCAASCASRCSANEKKIDRWTARFGCASAEWPAGPVDPFFNANAPEDLAAAEALLPSP